MDFFEQQKKINQSHRIKNPQTLEQKKQRLSDLQDMQEEGGCTPAVHSEAHRLNKNVNQPTLRQRLFGFRSGRLKKEDEDFLRVMELTQEMKKELRTLQEGTHD